jgi:hypothetical protein
VCGIVLEVGAIAKWEEWQPWSSVLAGVGGSVLATVLVGFLGSDGDKVYQAFLRLGVTEFYSSRNRFEDTEWVTWLRQAQHKCVLLGQAHGKWCTDRGFRPALLERVKAGVIVEIFFLDPTGSAAKVRSDEDEQNITPLLPRIRASITVLWNIRQELGAEEKERLKLYVYNATPSLGLTWIDNRMLVTHYLPTIMNLTSPALRVEYKPASDTLYAVYEDNMQGIHKEKFSTLITDANFDKYTNEGADVRE